MFYAHLILAKKGPLAKVWLAAHWDKKITKAHVFETNIEKSVEGILQPKVKLALRTSGHLLLGVVRIYSRKAKYLLADCNEAFVKIKMAFRPGMVDLPEGHREANVNAITLPEVFHDFDTALPELNDIDLEAQFSANQTRADEITLREDYGGGFSPSLHDNDFGDVGFDYDAPDMVRDNLDAALSQQLFEDDIYADKLRETTGPSITLQDKDEIAQHPTIDEDGFGDDFGQPELFGDDFFADPPRMEADNMEISKEALPKNPDESDDDDGIEGNFLDDRAPSPGFSSNASPLRLQNEDELLKNQEPEPIEKTLDQSTLIQNEEESFALAPVDVTAYKGVAKPKRKRKLIVDEVKNISGEEMKQQLANTTDIVTTLDLAAPTKMLMYWKETGGVEKLFSLPSRTIPARCLLINYNRHLVTHFTPLEDFTALGPLDLLGLDHVNDENDVSGLINNKRGRKRKHDLMAQPALIDNTLPEQMREQNTLLSNLNEPLEINTPNPNVTADNCATEPPPMFAMNNLSNMNNMTGLDDLNVNQRNVQQGIDSGDDYHGDLTPGNLHHGHMTPEHPEIENIESIPNIPVDQISSILNEINDSATNMPQANPNKSCELLADWNDNDDDGQHPPAPAPAPIEAAMPPPPPPVLEITNKFDEQMEEGETNEEFEERVLNKRAAQLFYAIRNRMVEQNALLLSELTVANSRKQAAQKFYSLLVLKKFRNLEITQAAPYEDIYVTKGTSFDNPKL